MDGGLYEAKEAPMKCPICRNGETRAGTATATLVRDGVTLVVEGVPADVCDNCGEEFVGEAEAARLLELGEDAARAGVRVDVRAYRAA